MTEEAFSVIEHKELENIKIASIETLKQKQMKFGIYDVLKSAKYFLEENISPETFDKNLQILIDNIFVKFNTVWNRICLCIPKNNTCKDALIIKEELQFFKSKLIK